MEVVRLLKRQVRRSQRLTALLQPPVALTTVMLRRARLRLGYRGKVLEKAAFNAWMAQRITQAVPTMVGKIGTLELEFLVHDQRSTRQPVPGELRRLVHENVGFFPDDDGSLRADLAQVRAALSAVDTLAVLGSAGERSVVRAYASQLSNVCQLGAIEPWGAVEPWTHALRGKRVLVIHPFARSIESQYHRARQTVWATQPGLLPELELRTLRMPLGPTLVPPTEKTWLERFERMRADMAAQPFDVAVIGAGGMSLPLAAHAKALGAIGIHMGGSSQILFGIRGKRWDEADDVRGYVNETWVRPAPEETPTSASAIEGGCYW